MQKETLFTVFCLESYKNYKCLTGREALKLFKEYDVFDYIRKSYDVLHTTGYQYINRDIDAYLNSRRSSIS